ncbi:hypothetical protein [Microbacterium suaedae]|uniref:hypothetical protein n=1 Tax=Microbacterium suaedae TaxID=2067813 RepID=UPI0018E08EE1|nr:hypothetical protein [Microbacterium suaedae]
MTEPQVWTLIGAFIGAMVALVTVMLAMTGRMFQGLRSELQTEMRAGFDRLEGVMNARFAAVDVRFEKVESTMDARFAQVESTMDARFAQVESTMDARFAQVESTMDARFAKVEAKIDHLDRDVDGLTRRRFDDEV